MTELTAEEACAARAHAQGLEGSRSSTVAEAVRRVVGLQAQDTRACRLSVRARTNNLTRSDVDSAVNDRSVVRTWAMRGTLHMLAAEDVSWIVGLLGPRFAKGLAGRRRQLGLNEDAGLEAIRAVLDQPLTRSEIVTRIADHGVVLDPKSQAPAHLLGYAALTGWVCRGPDVNDDTPTYVLSRDWIPDAATLSEEEALARLAARYLEGHGPAGPDDLAAWSGLPRTTARAAFEAIGEQTVQITLAGEKAFVLADDSLVENSPKPQVRLLGHFDTYLLGYRTRALAVPPELDRRIQTGGGFIMPAVSVSGRVIGTWRQAITKGRMAITVEPFTRIPKRLVNALHEDIADLGRFLGLPADLSQQSAH